MNNKNNKSQAPQTNPRRMPMIAMIMVLLAACGFSVYLFTYKPSVSTTTTSTTSRLTTSSTSSSTTSSISSILTTTIPCDTVSFIKNSNAFNIYINGIEDNNTLCLVPGIYSLTEKNIPYVMFIDWRMAGDINVGDVLAKNTSLTVNGNGALSIDGYYGPNYNGTLP